MIIANFFYIVVFLCCFVWMNIGFIIIGLFASSYFEKQDNSSSNNILEQRTVRDLEDTYYCDYCECYHEYRDNGEKWNC